MTATGTSLRRIILPLLVVVLLVLIAILYSQGFRPGFGKYGFTRVGTLVVQNAPDGTVIYTDESRRGVVKHGTLRVHLLPGAHTLIVGSPNYYPWNDLIQISSGTELIAHPILVSTAPNGHLLAGDESKKALEAIAATALPDTEHPLHVGCQSVSVVSNQIIVDAATSTPSCVPPPYLCIAGSCAPTIVFAPLEPLSAVAAFPGRTDAVVVSFGNSIYVLELDPRSPQFFAPVLRGIAPKLGVEADGSLVVSDQAAVYQLSF